MKNNDERCEEQKAFDDTVIKLVVWDLDDTLWSGTLSEGNVELCKDFATFITALTDRGIVNSICSKNDAKIASDMLAKMGLLDYFVFSSINWEPKGERVKWIIDAMNLQYQNVLFVDDNPTNLEEAAFFCPGLKLILPCELKKSMNTPLFSGKNDVEHNRLKQYKLLEKRYSAKAEHRSNEEFLKCSDIKVEMITDCKPYIDRIYEMIHRNNQLNFTKDYISRPQVEKLFTDNEVISGIVHVSDKYGDHGVVGCYAIREGKAEQFVFSCRILGMSVEQWVYSKLGYPHITVVGDVASELNDRECPDWINQEKAKCVSAERQNYTDTNQHMIVYGSCPLRPTWSYIEPKLPHARFAEIDPDPSVCNLAVAYRESDETIAKILDNVSIFDSDDTFCMDVFSSDTDSVLICLSAELAMKKYISKTDGSYFFAKELSAGTSASEQFLNEYAVYPMTAADIEFELSYICKHLSPSTTLLIQTMSEVEFPTKGKDSNYYNRIKLNQIAEKLSADFDCVHLIDIRNYAKSPSDFFNSWANHFNRAIGFFLAQEILEFVGVDSNEKNNNTLPYGTVIGNLDDNKSNKAYYTMYICNGKLVIKLTGLPYNASVRFKIYNNRFVEGCSDWLSDDEYSLRVDNPGYWYAVIDIGRESEYISIETKGIDYNEFNYALYSDTSADNYENWRISMECYCVDNAKYHNIEDQMIMQLAKLSAAGADFNNYFLQKDIKEISIFVSRKISQVLLPMLASTKLKINYIFTTEMLFGVTAYGDSDAYIVNDLESAITLLSDSDCLLMADSGRCSEKYSGIFRSLGVQLIFLPYMLGQLMTETFFCSKKSKINNADVYCVRMANIMPFGGFPYSSIKPNERAAFKKLHDDTGALRVLDKGKALLPEQFQNIPEDELRETLLRPEFVMDSKKKLMSMASRVGKYVNIKDGFRVTTDQPEKYINTIYIFGGYFAYGYGVQDSSTIASCLQRAFGNQYRVCCRANFWYEQNAGDMLRLIDSVDFKEGDIAVIIMSGWQKPNAYERWHWLEWNGIHEPIHKIDTFPMFSEVNRPDYFLLPCALTSECYNAVAELIYQEITQSTES